MSTSVSSIFPSGLPSSLYTVLHLDTHASSAQIRGAYRTLALVHHPDKHATASQEQKDEHALVFQQVGFAYVVLSDAGRREKYDLTGSVEELSDLGGEAGWDAYFEQLFEEVTKSRLDEDKVLYQGGDEELEDLKRAYVEHEGDLPSILDSIPHSNYTDEPRLLARLKLLVADGTLPSFPAWEKTLADKRAARERKKQGKAEEKEAEEMAKELGVWDEFYGTGKKGARQGNGKGKGKNGEKENEEEDTSALQALILKKRQNAGNFLDNLAAKYAQPEKPNGNAKGKGKSKKRPAPEEEEEESPKKMKKDVHDELDGMDDELFRKLQEGMFGKREGGKKGRKGK
ncbi:DnaJ-domain-containing protein [Dacryopinax primogenitus]|uniref:DnaJ-domain-containing protein n=1 Tax=Dacryopinax primogenitus (strain DJM 731) TaxID=1858805 RepID=M5FQ70_DACPD|nr:DnaJ-domain-containing protein [Dacryopinax primogenitus]EJT96774.1 DnaJ-domain-containing protein [Dacryopinax primogenitus]